MPQIEAIESIERLFETEKRAREAADARTHDWQKQVRKGDCFKRVTPDGLEIFAEVLREYTLPDMRNFRECRCYSFVCPEGEVGDVHVSTIDSLIDRATFEMARSKLIKAWRLALKRLNDEANYEQAMVNIVLWKLQQEPSVGES